MTETPVLIIGGGPVGLMGSLLLSQLGVPSLLVDERPSTSSHPRARVYDRCTLELLRQVGVDEEFARTGLGPSWTQHLRWFDALAGTQLCRIPSPSFHSERVSTSPCFPVTSSQDLLEEILYRKAMAAELSDVRFGTRAESLSQDADGCRATLRSVDRGEQEEVAASYVIAADGVRSQSRDVIDCPLSGERLEVFFQDVLFHADLDRWIGDRKGSLLFVAHAQTGGAVFQPLDGRTRWRCQIGNFPRDEQITDEFCVDWIKSAVGTDENVDIRIESVSPWRFTAATAVTFSQGRVFLAGDAAHVFIPTGGLGSNTGLVGIRNLAWKLAYVAKGLAPASILETYDSEHRTLAANRVKTSYENAMLVGAIFEAHDSGGDVAAAAEACRQYADYEGLILGYEHSSPLCVPDTDEEPVVDNPIKDYVAVVRSGRRAPHAWVGQEKSISTVDWFTTDYVIILTDPASPRWLEAVAEIRRRGFPIRIEHLPDVAGTPYEGEQAVVVRPDGIVAVHVPSGLAAEPSTLLQRCLPMAA